MKYLPIYPSINCISIFICIVLSYRTTTKRIADRNILPLSIVSGIIIAFSVFVGSRFATMLYYPHDIWSINFFKWCVQRNVRIFHAGFIMAFVPIIITARLMKYRPLLIMDMGLLYLPIGHAIGRIGCLASGCCWGQKVSVTFLNTVYSFNNPVPLYSILLNTLLFAVLLYLNKLQQNDTINKAYGIISSTYFILYGSGRFILEFIRVEPKYGIGLTQAQFVSIIFICIGIFILARILYVGGWIYCDPDCNEIHKLS